MAYKHFLVEVTAYIKCLLYIPNGSPFFRYVSKHEKIFKNNPENKIIKDVIWLLYETSILDSSFSIDKPRDFTGRIHRIMSLDLVVQSG